MSGTKREVCEIGHNNYKQRASDYSILLYSKLLLACYLPTHEYTSLDLFGTCEKSILRLPKCSLRWLIVESFLSSFSGFPHGVLIISGFRSPDVQSQTCTIFHLYLTNDHS